MGKSTTFDNDLLELVLNGAPIANIADNAASGPLANLYVSAHTADPGAGGNQTTSEASYGSYARQPTARPGGWTVTGSQASPAAVISFPTPSSGSGTLTHWAVGTDISGAGKILYSGTITPNITIATGLPVELSAASTITES